MIAINFEKIKNYTSNNCEVGVIRFTYYRGLLEIMTPLNPHDGNKKLLGRLVST